MVDSSISDFAPPGAPPTPPAAPAAPAAPRPERRGRGERRVAWFGARARNALRRPGRYGAVASVVFAATLLTLIFVPRQAQRAYAALTPRADEWRDSSAAQQAISSAGQELETARRQFLAARAAATAPLPAPPAPVVTLSAEQLQQRDSLRQLIDLLQAQIARVDRAPLPASYRQLGELPTLAAEPRVRSLLDSLSQVEREREEFAALGGVDPIYVSLTSRVNAIGRGIQSVAERQLADARGALAALVPPAPPPPPVVERPVVDTIVPMGRVVSAQQRLRRAEEELREVRRVNAALAARAEAARQGANFIAPPAAVLGAAIVLALVTGYLVVLIGELRLPRVADGAEIERETGRRTLAVIGGASATATAERSRRRGDERTPELLDPLADAYRMLYLHLSPMGAALPIVTVTGDEPSVVAKVAANLAAAAAQDARSPLLIDADLSAGAVAGALRVRSRPGIAELLRGEAAWVDTISSALFGRERMVDVIPAGSRAAAQYAPAPSTEFRQELQRIARRYDLTVMTAALAQVASGSDTLLSSPDVILCVRASETPLRDLHASVDALHGAGLRLLGVVLWDSDLPALA